MFGPRSTLFGLHTYLWTLRPSMAYSREKTLINLAISLCVYLQNIFVFHKLNYVFNSFSFSSPLVNPARLHFVFNIVEFPHSNGRAMARQGICTGWLNDKTQGLQGQIAGDSIDKDMAAMSLDDKCQQVCVGHVYIKSEIWFSIIIASPIYVQPRLFTSVHNPMLSQSVRWLRVRESYFGDKIDYSLSLKN